MSNRRQPEQQAPPVQRLQVRYAKRDRARFASHRDFSRAFERALGRAGIPMAYSSGFNPHPRVSFANAAPTGAATEAEYLEIGLRETVEAQRVREALNAALPTGIEVLDVAEGVRGLADLLTASRWRVRVDGVPSAVVADATSALLAAPELTVDRMTKTGLRTFDVRAAVQRMVVDGGEVDLVLAHTAPLVRPDDVMRALAQVHEGFAPTATLLTRTEQGVWNGDRIAGPFEAVRGA